LSLFEKNFNIFFSQMIKWFAYIVVFLIFTPYLSSAKITKSHFDSAKLVISLPVENAATDTTKNKKPDPDDKKTIKEVAKAKRQPKPEKVEPDNSAAASKNKKQTKRQRRPEGLERPPEIPRRNGS
jgi:hypothetical protein